MTSAQSRVTESDRKNRVVDDDDSVDDTRGRSGIDAVDDEIRLESYHMTQHSQTTTEEPEQRSQPSMQYGQPQITQSQQQPGGQQQIGGQEQITGQQQPAREFEDTLNRDMRLALHDFVQATTVCNWCADQCLGDPMMEECARLCRDVADLAALNVQFLARDSIFGVDVAETFAYAAEECEQVCAQHPDPHCQECASVLSRAVESTRAMLDSFGHIPQEGQQPSMQQY